MYSSESSSATRSSPAYKESQSLIIKTTSDLIGKFSSGCYLHFNVILLVLFVVDVASNEGVALLGDVQLDVVGFAYEI